MLLLSDLADHSRNIAADDRVLAVLPLAFDYGQNQLLSTWYAGGAVIPHLTYVITREQFAQGPLARKA